MPAKKKSLKRLFEVRASSRMKGLGKPRVLIRAAEHKDLQEDFLVEVGSNALYLDRLPAAVADDKRRFVVSEVDPKGLGDVDVVEVPAGVPSSKQEARKTED